MTNQKVPCKLAEHLQFLFITLFCFTLMLLQNQLRFICNTC